MSNITPIGLSIVPPYFFPASSAALIFGNLESITLLARLICADLSAGFSVGFATVLVSGLMALSVKLPAAAPPGLLSGAAGAGVVTGLTLATGISDAPSGGPRKLISGTGMSSAGVAVLFKKKLAALWSIPPRLRNTASHSRAAFRTVSASSCRSCDSSTSAVFWKSSMALATSP